MCMENSLNQVFCRAWTTLLQKFLPTFMIFLEILNNNNKSDYKMNKNGVNSVGYIICELFKSRQDEIGRNP